MLAEIVDEYQKDNVLLIDEEVVDHYNANKTYDSKKAHNIYTHLNKLKKRAQANKVVKYPEGTCLYVAGYIDRVRKNRNGEYFYRVFANNQYQEFSEKEFGVLLTKGELMLIDAEGNGKRLKDTTKL